MFTHLVAQFVTLPDKLQLAITLGVVFVVGYIFSWLITKFPWLADFIGQYKDTVAFGLAAALVAWVQQLLNTIPAQYDEIVSAVLNLVVVLLVFFGVPLGLKRLATKANLRGFRF